MTHHDAVSTFASERYLLEEMTELERHSFEDHFFDCAECAEDVRAGAYLREGAKAGLVATSTTSSSTVLAFPSKPVARPMSTFVPWAAAASLALFAGYQTLLLNNTTRFEPQALAPVSLRPASRGADPIVVVDGDKPVALAIEVNDIGRAGNAGQPARDLSYDLRTIDGPGSILSGRVPAPEAGAPLFLLVPGSSLPAPGRYLLRVTDDTGQSIGEYRFAAKTR